MLEGLEPPEKAFRCKVATVLNDLEPDDTRIFAQALADEGTWPAWTLSQALKGRGIPLGDGPIRNHRRGSCRCRVA